MSIIGFASWFIIGGAAIYLWYKAGLMVDSGKSALYGVAAMIGVPALVVGSVFGLQLLGINMGTWLMYHGVMLIPAGGI